MLKACVCCLWCLEKCLAFLNQVNTQHHAMSIAQANIIHLLNILAKVTVCVVGMDNTSVTFIVGDNHGRLAVCVLILISVWGRGGGGLRSSVRVSVCIEYTTTCCRHFNFIQKALWHDYCCEHYCQCITYLYFLYLMEVCFLSLREYCTFVNA